MKNASPHSQNAPTPAEEWAVISRQLFTEIVKHPGVNLAYRQPSAEELASMSQAEADDAMVLADQAAKERRGYTEAMAPLRALVMRGKVKRTDPRIWKLTFALGKGEFRPRYGAVEVMVADLFDIPETEADAKAQEVVDSRSALPPVPIDRKESPVWLAEFAEAVGDCEYANAFLIPLLNMSDERARSAIAAIAQGRQRAKEPRAPSGQDARLARKAYVDACLKAVKAHQRGAEPQGRATEPRRGQV